MSKHDKTLIKIFRQPTVSDLKWDELTSLLKSLGYSLHKKAGGSRRKFIHQTSNHIISCHEPHPSPHVAKYCVEQIADALRRNGHAKE